MCIMFLVKILKMTLIITLMITVDFRSSVTLDSVEREGWWLPGHSKVSTMEQLKVYSICMYRLFGSVEQCRECKYMKWERCPGGCLEKDRFTTASFTHVTHSLEQDITAMGWAKHQ